MLSLILPISLFGTAACLPQSAVPSAVVACYTLPLEFAVNVQFSTYRPCFCIRDHNALVTPLGSDEPCLLVRSAEATTANLNPYQYSQWFWETTEGYRYSYAECWRDDIPVCQMVLGSQEKAV